MGCLPELSKVECVADRSYILFFGKDHCTCSTDNQIIIYFISWVIEEPFQIKIVILVFITVFRGYKAPS